MTVRPVAVVGGGAAGMLAAWRAASLGTGVSLLEKNARPGLKIHISGGGKCNITHGGDMESLRRAFAPAEARFLAPAFRRFSNEDVLDLLRARGVSLHTRADGRVFPDSGRADDVVEALAWHLRTAGVEVLTGRPVTGLSRVPGGLELDLEGHRCLARAVVVAVGGASYPKTGTTGDGYRWLRALGHTIVPPRASLAPLYLAEGRRPEYSGVALRDVVLKARAGGRVIAEWRGDLLYTHQGLSGPCALGVSQAVARALECGPVALEADLLPDRTREEVTAELERGRAESGRRSLRSVGAAWLPDRLVPELLERAETAPGTMLNQLGRRNRHLLVSALKAWSFGEVRAVPLEKGEVTAGGVALEEVDPGTMASRLVPGLFLCGEVLDIQGPIGGYNLQAAFSTGFVAGEAAAAFVRAWHEAAPE